MSLASVSPSFEGGEGEKKPGETALISVRSCARGDRAGACIPFDRTRPLFLPRRARRVSAKAKRWKDQRRRSAGGLMSPPAKDPSEADTDPPRTRFPFSQLPRLTELVSVCAVVASPSGRAPPPPGGEGMVKAYLGRKRSPQCSTFPGGRLCGIDDAVLMEPKLMSLPSILCQ